MIKQALALAVFATLAPTAAPAFEAPPACSVTITYASVAGTVDAALAQKIDRQFRHDPRIVKRQRHPGHRGSYEICLTVQPPNKARTVFRAIRALMPANSSKAPTTLSFAGGRYVTKLKVK